MHELDFVEPANLAEASRMAAELGENGRFIAGGTALLLALRQRMLAPSHLVSLARIDSLRGIRIDDRNELHIGALTTHHAVATSDLVRRHSPMLADMAAQVANPQVRRQGTLGGNLCYADPATDPPGCLLALGARVRLVSHRGQRDVAMDDFLVDYFTTALEPDELVQEVIVPPQPAGTLGHYARFLRTAAEHRPMVSVAALATMAGGVCTEARIVVGAAVVVARRLADAEACLAGQRPSIHAIERAADAACAAISPLDDLRGSADYRRDMVGVQIRRSLTSMFGLQGSAS